MKDRDDKIKELKALIIVMGILLALRASFTVYDTGYSTLLFWSNFPGLTEISYKLRTAILEFGKIVIPIINIALPILFVLAIVIIVDLIFIKKDD